MRLRLSMILVPVAVFVLRCGGSAPDASQGPEELAVICCAQPAVPALRELRVDFSCVSCPDAGLADAGDAGDAGDGGCAGDAGDAGDGGCAGSGDAGRTDAGLGDAGLGDAGAGDGGTGGDGGAGDGGATDGGGADGGTDGGSADGGGGDGGSSDAGCVGGVVDSSGYCCDVGQSCGAGTGSHYELQSNYCVCVQDTDAGTDAGADAGCNPGTCWTDDGYNVCDLNDNTGHCIEVDCAQPKSPCVGQATSNGLSCCGAPDAGPDGGGGGAPCTPGACWSDPPYNVCDLTNSSGGCTEVDCASPKFPCADPSTSTGLGCCGPPDAGPDAGSCTPGTCWADAPYNVCDMNNNAGACTEVDCYGPLVPCVDPASSIGLGCCGSSDAGACTPGTCWSSGGTATAPAASMAVVPSAPTNSCTLVDNSGDCETVNCTAPDEPCYDPSSPTGLSCCGSSPRTDHFRALFTNVGNVSLSPSCMDAENKLCDPGVTTGIRNYIGEWEPDIIMISEVAIPKQMASEIHGIDLWPRTRKHSADTFGGPILPAPGTHNLTWDYTCHDSHKRNSGYGPGIWDPQGIANGLETDKGDWSHGHECVAWRRDKFKKAGEMAVFGKDADANCHHDFTIEMADLESIKHPGFIITAVAVHPQSDTRWPRDTTTDIACRKDEIARAFAALAGKAHVVMGGDFNTESMAEINPPARYATDFSKGQHFGGHLGSHPSEHSAGEYIGRGWFNFDHVFRSNQPSWAAACTTCGGFYGTKNLVFGSALGYKVYDIWPWYNDAQDDHPNICGDGCDHAQVLVDYTYTP